MIVKGCAIALLLIGLFLLLGALSVFVAPHGS